MKLLIVDDEELTRVGVVSSINWRSLGIDEILQADDGVNGLEMARLYRPEIILCDVRMPRMNGIAMLEQVEKILPDTVSIFMSGYSDKEYLKAAIRLKTVNYVEKPLDPAEIQEAVLEAIRLYRQKQHSHRGEELHSLQTASRLALLLTMPYETNQKSISELSDELGLSLSQDTFFMSVIIHPQKIPEDPRLSYDSICHRFQDYIDTFDFNCIYIEKKLQHIVYFIFGNGSPFESTITDIVQFIGNCYIDFGNYHIAAGEPYTGIASAYRSYTDAVVLLQSSFFFPAGTLLTSDFLSQIRNEPEEPDFAVSMEAAFEKAVSSMDAGSCDRFLEALYQHYDGNHALLPNQVRDLYYKLFLVLEEASRQRHLTANIPAPAEGIMDAIENAFTYHELHQALSDRTHRFLEEASQAAPENPTIVQIKDYISKNYQNELLSVKDISSHVFLSVSYVCTYFKNETGQTLNQYLTEYRMERAKELLQDARYKITDISSKVGYSDGNYFGKSFKKYSGLSPSEYREKMTR
ncbi:MAG: response regulator [Lachnospiraceae bacterium]|nr:response regulator [Lachnospiraceae bacterium]